MNLAMMQHTLAALDRKPYGPLEMHVIPIEAFDGWAWVLWWDVEHDIHDGAQDAELRRVAIDADGVLVDIPLRCVSTTDLAKWRDEFLGELECREAREYGA